MSLLSSIKSLFTKGAEGSYRGPVTGYSHWGNPFQIPFGDGFQAGLTLNNTSAQNVPIAYACVMATARAVSVCSPSHVVEDNGKRTKSSTSPASRVLRKPNTYQTWPQFILDCVTQMLFIGEAFVLLSRDDRYAVNALHMLPRGSCSPYVSVDGEVFYSIGENPMSPQQTSMMAPSRDVMHLRQYCPRHPLIGESPLTAAALALGVNVALSGNQAAFYTNMNRPSGILSTDTILTRDQMQQLRQAFDEQAKGMNAGKIPVLSGGLKFSPISLTSQDSQLVEAQRMSIEDVARVFGVPLSIIGDLSKGSGQSTESTINFWLATGLSSTLGFLEKSFDIAFNLGPNEYIEFDTKSLLRMDYQARVEGLTKAVQGGILSPNEARESEQLPPVTDGDKIFLQQQMVPIDLLTDLHTANLTAKLKPAATAAPAAAPASPAPTKTADVDTARALVVDLFSRKRA